MGTARGQEQCWGLERSSQLSLHLTGWRKRSDVTEVPKIDECQSGECAHMITMPGCLDQTR